MINIKRIFVVTKREAAELFRDPGKVVGNFIVPLVLMFLFSSGINVDVKNIPFVILDHDNTRLSRSFANSYINSEYYDFKGYVATSDDAEKYLKQDIARFYLDIPAGFGMDLASGKGANIATFVDGTQPFRAETIKGYVMGTDSSFLYNTIREETGSKGSGANFDVLSRFWYNQASESKYSFVPGVIAVILLAVPSIMMTLSIPKEKEQGTITNFYATPLSKFEFLIGKQLLYIGIFFLVYLGLVSIAVFCYRVPIKGSFLILSALTIIYIFCSTSIGLLVSVFTKTQIAGLMISLIATMVPSFTFSGLLTPISSLDTGGQITARIYPIIYYMRSILGIFTKDLSLKLILPNFLYLIIFYVIVMSLCNILLKKQEK